MKTILFLFVALTASAQIAIPTTPTKFGKKNLGASTDTITNGASSASVGAKKPENQTVIRTTTYWTLSGARQWTNADGKPLLARMIAFEDITVEQVKGQPAPEAPKLPGKPTVVKNGKVRLMVGQQLYEIAVEKLSEKDREFIDTMKRAVDKTDAK
jgi:hypothetical protein